MPMQENIALIRFKIEQAAKEAGRCGNDILLCAASKTQSAETVKAAAALDIDIFGENRVQELVAKNEQGAYLSKPRHLIGQLQTNKVKKVVGLVSLIQSVDSLHLLEAIEKEAQKQNIIQDVLLEINIGREESKSGMAPENVISIIENAEKMDFVRIKGLMTVPPAGTGDAENRGYFAAMRRMFDDFSSKGFEKTSMQYLSMGMSGDFENAVKEGANIVRIGTAIFGARDYSKNVT